MTKLTLAAALALSLTTGAAFAQTAPATAPSAGAATAAAPAPKTGSKPRTPQSIECSKKANAGNMHGKPRQAFMRKCKEGKS